MIFVETFCKRFPHYIVHTMYHMKLNIKIKTRRHYFFKAPRMRSTKKDSMTYLLFLHQFNNSCVTVLSRQCHGNVQTISQIMLPNTFLLYSVEYNMRTLCYNCIIYRITRLIPYLLAYNNDDIISEPTTQFEIYLCVYNKRIITATITFLGDFIGNCNKRSIVLVLVCLF